MDRWNKIYNKLVREGYSEEQASEMASYYL